MLCVHIDFSVGDKHKACISYKAELYLTRYFFHFDILTNTRCEGAL